MKTSATYIHEYSILDDINETLSDAITDVTKASYEYESVRRDFELKSFFEGTSLDVVMEAEKAGIFERIGNAIIKIIKKISEAISKFTKKFFGKSEEIESDVDIVNQIAARNPELKSTICKGIKEEWFTYKDVAKYQKDIIGLTNMLEQQTIDHKTFRQKCSESLEKFNKSGAIIVGTATTILGVLAIIPKIHKTFKQNKKVVEESKPMLEKLRSKLGVGGAKDNKSQPEPVKESVSSISPETASVIVSEYSKAVSVMTQELNHVVASQNAVGGILKSFINEHK